MSGPAQAPGFFRSQLEQRVDRGLMDAGFLVDDLRRDFRENLFQFSFAEGIAMMIGGRDEGTIRLEEQVIRSPRIATDAVNGLIEGADCTEPVQSFLVQLRDIPLECIVFFDRHILELADLAHA